MNPFVSSVRWDACTCIGRQALLAGPRVVLALGGILITTACSGPRVTDPPPGHAAEAMLSVAPSSPAAQPIDELGTQEIDPCRQVQHLRVGMEAKSAKRILGGGAASRTCGCPPGVGEEGQVCVALTYRKPSCTLTVVLSSKDSRVLRWFEGE